MKYRIGPWIKLIITCLISLVMAFVWGCSKSPTPVSELRHYPIDSMQDMKTQSGVEIDSAVSSDGKGSLRIIAEKPTVVRLFETGDLDIENASLLYQAKLRTEELQGKAYLEMWCHFPGKGEFFSRGLTNPVSGTVEWTTQETSFFLQQEENPDNIKLNLVIEGSGTAWIDDVHLSSGPLS